NRLKQTNGIANLIQQDEIAIKEYFTVRSKDVKGSIKPHIENCR
ncbi:unnamed protein product, partial [marine sediment metagenome]